MLKRIATSLLLSTSILIFSSHEGVSAQSAVEKVCQKEINYDWFELIFMQELPLSNEVREGSATRRMYGLDLYDDNNNMSRAVFTIDSFSHQGTEADKFGQYTAGINRTLSDLGFQLLHSWNEGNSQYSKVRSLYLDQPRDRAAYQEVVIDKTTGIIAIFYYEQDSRVGHPCMNFGSFVVQQHSKKSITWQPLWEVRID